MTDTMAITVTPLETPTLGDRSYLVHDGEVAFAVDPSGTSTASWHCWTGRACG
jgi:hypothetical protein